MALNSLLLLAFLTLVNADFELTILHSNDFHSTFDEVSASMGVCSEEQRKLEECYGGFSRNAHMYVFYQNNSIFFKDKFQN